MSKVCQICDGPLTGRQRATCSSDCRAEAARRRAADWYALHRDDAALKVRVAESKRRKYAKEKADPDAWTAKLAGTKAWREAYPDRRLDSERRWMAANPDRARAKVQRRRARIAGAFVEDIDLGVVFERDSGICGICGELVDPALKWPDRMSKTLDHIVPLSRGGLHEYSNAQLAHAVCNSRKSDRLEQVAIAPQEA